MKIRFAAAVAIGSIALVCMLTGCKKTISDKDLTFLDPDDAVDVARGSEGILNIVGKETAVWVDPRQPRDYDAGHIEGAINLPFNAVLKDHEQLLEYDVLIVYGNDYNDAVAEGMSKRLMELGHDDVRTLRGGLRAWKAAGNEVVKSE